MADKIKETAKQEISATAKQASDAAKSGAYLYPLQVSHLPASSQHLLTCTGHLLLLDAQVTMEALPQSPRAHHGSRSGSHDRHVLLHIPTPTGSPILHIRTPGGCFDSRAGSIRVQYPHYGSCQDSFD